MEPGKFHHLPNSNYVHGRAREYQVMHTLRESGWVCTRSAMSHGPVDLIAAKKGKILLIQVKSGSARVSRSELKSLKSWGVAFRGQAQVWSFKKRGQIDKKIVFDGKKINRRTGLKNQQVLESVSIASLSSSLPIVDQSQISHSLASIA